MALRRAVLDAEPDAAVVMVDDAARALSRAAGPPALDVAFVADADTLGAIALASTLVKLCPAISLAVVVEDGASTKGVVQRMGLDAAVLRAPIAATEVAEFLHRSILPARTT